MKTYEERVSLINSALDIDKQINSAEREARKYRRQSKGNIRFDEKLMLNERSKACRMVAKRLRLNYFDLMDSLNLSYPTTKQEKTVARLHEGDKTMFL